MGVSGSTPTTPSKQPQLTPEEIARLVKETHFNEAEIKTLFSHFKAISGSMQDDDTIELNEFKATLRRKDETFTKRLFQVFDVDRNDHVDFHEFALGVSVFCERGTMEEKIKYSFKIYDIDGDGYIDKEELFEMLKASLEGNTVLDLTETQMHKLVEQTFQEVDDNGDGKISFTEYEAMVHNNPSILDSLTIRTAEFI